MHAIGMRLREQRRTIMKNLKSGKITKDQAKAAMEKLKTVRRKELDFFHANNQKEVTTDQKKQLDKVLDENAGAY